MHRVMNRRSRQGGRVSEEVIPFPSQYGSLGSVVGNGATEACELSTFRALYFSYNLNSFHYLISFGE